MTVHVRIITVFATAVLLLVTGCSSYGKLRADDPLVAEDEVARAGDAGAPADLTAHLVTIVQQREHRPTSVVVAALAALAKRRDPAAVAAIAGLKNDPDEEVRFHAAAALVAIGGEEARATLAAMATSDPSAIVREEAAGRAKER